MQGSYENKDKFDAFCGYPKHMPHYKSSFCEVVKVDMSKMNESIQKETVTHSLSLVKVLFEDFGVAVDIHGKAKDTDNTHPSPPMILLNDGFLFEKGIIQDEEYNPLEKECLKSLESLCVFDYCEYYKNLLCILVGFQRHIQGKATPVPKSMMGIFDLFYPALINHMMQQGKFVKQEFPHSYKLAMNRSKLIVSHTNTCPVQFAL